MACYVRFRIPYEIITIAIARLHIENSYLCQYFPSSKFNFSFWQNRFDISFFHILSVTYTRTQKITHIRFDLVFYGKIEIFWYRQNMECIIDALSTLCCKIVEIVFMRNERVNNRGLKIKSRSFW